MSSPTDSRDQTDPGDEVIRKFRYQHAYGVVLAILMVNQTRPYRAIWCEQHEDLLAERNDDQFEAFQVKTRKQETGAWNISDEGFVKSIRRFIALDSAYPGQIIRFYFVSNAEFSDSEAKQSAHLSPIKLMTAILACNSTTDLSDPHLKGFTSLRSLLGCDEDALFSVLKRFELVHGRKKQAQLENVVLSECDEAYLRAKSGSSLFGVTMLLDLQERMKRIATAEAMKAAGQPYEVLVGVAGLLSDECKVWWSEQFPMEDFQ